jgi:hypothetical protein
MSGNKQHINYSLADINDYLQGRLSPAEMHAMEKAALQDPFLADALEGLHEVDAVTAQNDLADIQAKLSAVKNPPAKLVRARTQTGWLKIAASIILVAGAGILGWYVFKEDTNKNELAQQAVATSKSTPVPLPQPDSATKPIAEKPAVVQQEAKNHIAAEKDAGSHVLANAEKEAAAKKINLPPADPRTVTAGAAADLQMLTNETRDQRQVPLTPASPTKPLYYFSGRIIDSSAKPIGNATISLNDHKGTVTDSGGRFSFISSDSLQMARVMVDNYDPVKVALSSAQPKQITLNKNKGTLDEVVITADAPKRKAGEVRFGDNLTGKAAGINQMANVVVDTSIRPANGWTGLYSYLDSSLQRSRPNIAQTDKAAQVLRFIRLELSLDVTGRPTVVTILETNDSSSNNTIIEAIKNGPVWVNQYGGIATGTKKLVLRFGAVRPAKK